MEDETPTKGPSTHEEWRLHALNIHGAFFEKRIAAEIDTLSSCAIIQTNFSVEYPPTEVGREGKHSALDIWARSHSHTGTMFNWFIECKKNNPELSEWIFFPSVKDSSRFSVSTLGYLPGQSSVVSMPRTVGAGLKRVADECREARSSYQSKEKKGPSVKTANDSIQNAAYQVAIAHQCLVRDSLFAAMSRRQTLGPDSIQGTEFFFPMVVTTANLFLCDFNPQEVDLASGELPYDRATFTPVEYVIYRYALPRILHAMPFELTGHNEKDRDRSTLDIVIVNSLAIKERIAAFTGFLG